MTFVLRFYLSSGPAMASLAIAVIVMALVTAAVSLRSTIVDVPGPATGAT